MSIFANFTGFCFGYFSGHILEVFLVWCSIWIQ